MPHIHEKSATLKQCTEAFPAIEYIVMICVSRGRFEGPERQTDRETGGMAILAFNLSRSTVGRSIGGGDSTRAVIMELDCLDWVDAKKYDRASSTIIRARTAPLPLAGLYPASLAGTYDDCDLDRLRSGLPVTRVCSSVGNPVRASVYAFGGTLCFVLTFSPSNFESLGRFLYVQSSHNVVLKWQTRCRLCFLVKATPMVAALSYMDNEMK